MFFLDPQFLKAATERAVKTAMQSVLLFLGVDLAGGIGSAGGFNALEADWLQMGGVALGGLVLSYVFSLASGFVGERETPSVTGETLTEPSEPEVLPQAFLDDVAGERDPDTPREG